VPGQVMHESTRRIVLQGSDGVIFVADSRKSESGPTQAYWTNMLKNLEANGLDPKTLPMVVQANKKDLPDSRDDDMADLKTAPAPGAAPVKPLVIPAVAIRGEGVVETLHILLTLCYRNLDRAVGLDRNWKLSEKEFLGQIFSHMDLRGTRLS
jgi:signal recognition particle receptor subunit beta